MTMSQKIMDTSRDSSDGSSFTEDDRELLALGYVPSFKREFSNLATVYLGLSPSFPIFTSSCR